MNDLKKLFANNKSWIKEKLAVDKHYFKSLQQLQAPDYLWIGCSDSRVPANEIVGLQPGELFVHRNVANVVVHTDMNCLSVLQFAIEVLKVKHIIVTGHYGCGGVRAALGNKQFGMIDNWLRNIKDVYRLHEKELSGLTSEQARFDRLCELNVLEQAKNVCYTRFVQNAWDRSQKLSVHAWIYDIGDGLLKDLGLKISNKKQIDPIYWLK